jgi:hypothetical protein
VKVSANGSCKLIEADVSRMLVKMGMGQVWGKMICLLAERIIGLGF